MITRSWKEELEFFPTQWPNFEGLPPRGPCHELGGTASSGVKKCGFEVPQAQQRSEPRLPPSGVTTLMLQHQRAWAWNEKDEPFFNSEGRFQTKSKQTCALLITLWCKTPLCRLRVQRSNSGKGWDFKKLPFASLPQHLLNLTPKLLSSLLHVLKRSNFCLWITLPELGA